MKGIINNTTQDLTFDQHRALIAVAEILEKNFNCKIYTAYVNADVASADRLHNFTFIINTYNSKEVLQ